MREKERNTYATLLHRPFLLKGKPTHAQEVARRISGAVAGEICTKSSQELISQQLAISGAVAGEIYSQVKLLSLALHYLPFASRFPLPHFTFAFSSPSFRSILCYHVPSFCLHLRLLKVYGSSSPC